METRKKNYFYLNAAPNELKAFRLGRGLTQEELSEASGIGVRRISKIENDLDFSVTSQTAQSLAAALLAAPEDVFGQYAAAKEAAGLYRLTGDKERERAARSVWPRIERFIEKEVPYYEAFLSAADMERMARETLDGLLEQAATEGIKKGREKFSSYALSLIRARWGREFHRNCRELQEEISKVKQLIAELGIQ